MGESDRRLYTNVGLIFVLCVLLISIGYQSSQPDEDRVVEVNQNTGEVVDKNSQTYDTLANRFNSPVITSDGSIYSYGFTSGDYQKFLIAMKGYSNERFGDDVTMTGSIVKSSLEYSEDDKTYSFQIEIDQKDSLLDATIVNGEADIHVTIVDDEGEFNRKVNK